MRLVNDLELRHAGLVVEAVVERLEVKRRPRCPTGNGGFSGLHSGDQYLFAVRVRHCRRVHAAPDGCWDSIFLIPPRLWRWWNASGAPETAPGYGARRSAGKAMGQNPRSSQGHPGVYRQPGCKAVLWRIASDIGRRAGRYGYDDWAVVMTEIGGFRMGPFALMDYIGNDVNYAVTESVFQACYFDPRYRPSHTQKRLVDAGQLGEKPERGFTIIAIWPNPSFPERSGLRENPF